MLVTIGLIVKGKVQGVYYRQSTRNKAAALGITGIVKNLTDGSVSIVATGEIKQLQLLTEWCKTGPASAIVKEVIVSDMAVTNFTAFQIVR